MNNNYYVKDQKASPYPVVTLPQFFRDNMRIIIEDRLQLQSNIVEPVNYEIFVAEAKEAGLRVLADNSITLKEYKHLGLSA